MDHKILFQTMIDIGFSECYINTCEQLDMVFGTYYAIPRENTPTIPIHRGTLQGEIIFTIFMEPLLRWLFVGSKGYNPKANLIHPSTSTYMSYDDHGYADDINITTSTMESIQT